MSSRAQDLRDLKALCKSIAQDFGVSLRFQKQAAVDEAIGRSWYDDGEKVSLYAGDHPVDYILSVFFHELGHVTCRRRRRYPAYHGLTRGWRSYAQAVVRHGLQAERYVDKVGQQISEQYFPRGAFRWYPSYQSAEDVAWFKAGRRKYWAQQLAAD